MGFIFNKWPLILGTIGLAIGYQLREGFCFSDCINDALTVKSMFFFGLGLFIIGLSINWSMGAFSNKEVEHE